MPITLTKTRFDNAKDYYSCIDSTSLLFELCKWAQQAVLSSEYEREHANTQMCAIRSVLKDRLTAKKEESA